jgi:hypothetical protein
MTTGVVDWGIFGAWLDTEGNISSTITKMRKNERVGLRRAHELAVYQDDKHALEVLRDFLIESGVTRPYLYQDKRTGVWSLKIYRIKDIELVLLNVEPFLLTAKKRMQMEKFRLYRSDRFKRFPKVSN